VDPGAIYAYIDEKVEYSTRLKALKAKGGGGSVYKALFISKIISVKNVFPISAPGLKIGKLWCVY